jgi:ankyrin repeat protein
MKSFPDPGQNVLLKASRLAAIVLVALACTSIAFASAIHDAARKGDVKKIQALLASDPKLVADKDGDGDTPLHVAAKFGQLEAAQALVAAGADVNIKNTEAPFLPGDLWDIVGSNNHKDPVDLLRVHGVNTEDNKNGYTPLDMAAFSVHYMPMVKFLIDKGADVNAKSAAGATPLFWAVLRQQRDEVQYLVDHGADVNATDAYGDTILDMVLHLQYTTMLPILLAKDVDVNAVDQSGHRPLTYAMQMDDHKWAEMLKKKGAHE